MKLVSPFLFSFFLSVISYSQPVFFEKWWGGASYDYGRSVRQLSDSNIYVFGFSDAGPNGGFDYALNKLDKHGNLKWTKYYGDSLDDNGFCMNTTSDGNFIVTGESYSGVSDIDILVCKIDTAGILLWSKKYGTPFSNESARSIIQTSDGGYALCGFKTDSSGSNDCYVVRTDSAGDTLWTKMIGGTDNEYATAIHETAGGNLFVSADTKSFGAGGYDVELFLLDPANGSVLWDHYYGDSLNNGSQGTSASWDGNILCWGETEIFQYSPFDFYIEKLDTLGHSIWKKVFGGLPYKSDAAFSLCETADKSLVFAGYSNSYTTGPLDLVVFKTDSAGDLKWIRTYGDAGIDIGYEIIASHNNGFLIAGITDKGAPDYYLLHLDTMGTMMGVHPFDNDSKNIFSVYPNPTAGIISVGCQQVSLAKPISYKVFTLVGQVVDSGVVNDNFLSLSESVTSGIFFLQLSTDSISEIKKVAVIRE